ncbi:unnamed protein product [Caenorhabditis auriculariae]|uniref:Uncharacterized protein n=1 Tax=Caenorhabditis auriculariae TaxID=2777116 RepID=A0A8S1HP18_9PELO|nr:unnamed protein product [Caenorhabditis auriculariae]
MEEVCMMSDKSLEDGEIISDSESSKDVENRLEKDSDDENAIDEIIKQTKTSTEIPVIQIDDDPDELREILISQLKKARANKEEKTNKLEARTTSGDDKKRTSASKRPRKASVNSTSREEKRSKKTISSNRQRRHSDKSKSRKRSRSRRSQQHSHSHKDRDSSKSKKNREEPFCAFGMNLDLDNTNLGVLPPPPPPPILPETIEIPGTTTIPQVTNDNYELVDMDVEEAPSFETRLNGENCVEKPRMKSSRRGSNASHDSRSAFQRSPAEPSYDLQLEDVENSLRKDSFQLQYKIDDQMRELESAVRERNKYIAALKSCNNSISVIRNRISSTQKEKKEVDLRLEAVSQERIDRLCSVDEFYVLDMESNVLEEGRASSNLSERLEGVGNDEDYDEYDEKLLRQRLLKKMDGNRSIGTAIPMDSPKVTPQEVGKNSDDSQLIRSVCPYDLIGDCKIACDRVHVERFVGGEEALLALVLRQFFQYSEQESEEACAQLWVVRQDYPSFNFFLRSLLQMMNESQIRNFRLFTYLVQPTRHDYIGSQVDILRVLKSHFDFSNGINNRIVLQSPGTSCLIDNGSCNFLPHFDVLR